jgi:hypothetical protein
MAARALKKPLLSKHHKKKRLEWAKKYSSWTEVDWEKVLFTDESKIELRPVIGDGKVWRRVGESLHEDCIDTTVKHGGGNVMVWGCIGNSNPGELYFVEDKLTGEQYIKILQTTMLPSAKKLIGEDFIFQEDNDPKHGGENGCKIVKKWLTDNKIIRLNWPAQSPDMNPIEHVWGMLKRRLAPLKPKNLEELRANIKQEFKNIDKQYVSDLIKSMPRRVQALIKAKGGHTKY